MRILPSPAFREYAKAWNAYRDALSAKDQALFDQLMEMVRRHDRTLRTITHSEAELLTGYLLAFCLELLKRVAWMEREVAPDPEDDPSELAA